MGARGTPYLGMERLERLFSRRTTMRTTPSEFHVLPPAGLADKEAGTKICYRGGYLL